MSTTGLQSRIIKTANVKWKGLLPLQHEGFKDLTPEAKAKLRQSLLDNQFAQPYYIWHNEKEGMSYCLDGYHRVLVLKELEGEGKEIPEELPATFIRCENKQEAAKLVLIYSSMYARITPEGFEGFMQLYNLNEEVMRMEVSIPGITDMPQLPELNPSDPFSDEGISVKNQYGVIVMCESESDQETAFQRLSDQGYNCKIVVT